MVTAKKSAAQRKGKCVGSLMIAAREVAVMLKASLMVIVASLSCMLKYPEDCCRNNCLPYPDRNYGHCE